MPWQRHAEKPPVGESESDDTDVCLALPQSQFSARMDPSAYEPILATSLAALLQSFDGEVAKAKRVMASAADTSAAKPWRLTTLGQVRFEKPRKAVFRDMTLSHLVHHR